MTISTQALGLGSAEAQRLNNLLDQATPRRQRVLENLMAKSVKEAISDSSLTAANVNSKIADRLRINIPEITGP